MTEHSYAVIGGGLAGCECALRLARAGLQVTLFEQKPEFRSPAHVNDGLAELVCSNSLRSDELTSGIGLLKAEMRELGSDFMELADAHRVPAGKALAVDREAFSAAMTQRVRSTPGITLVHRQITSLDDPALDGFETVVLAAGPMASENLSASLAEVVGGDHCYFYDAIAPIVAADSIDMGIAFWGSRYGEPGEGDYLNCPMNEDEYKAFYQGLLDGVPTSFPALMQAQKISRKAVAAGFEWDTLDDVWTQVGEEIAELKEAYAAAPKGSKGKISVTGELPAGGGKTPEELVAAVELEFGDVLFALVNVARKMGVDGENALRATCAKFRSRWAHMERQAWAQGRAIEDLSTEEQERLWQQAKAAERR